MNTILFGNGFNLLNGTTSWDKLVHGINDSNDKAIIPNTLQYEAKIMQLPDKKPESFSKNSELSLKNDIAAEMSKYKSNEGKDDVTVPRMSDRLDGEFGPTYSWIDLFFKSNVYIVGFSLLYEEID